MELRDEDEKPATPAAMLAERAMRARRRAGLSLRALGERLGYPHSYLGRVEHGDQLPSDALAEALDEFYGTDGLFADLLAVARSAEIPSWGRRVLEEEKRAVRIQTFNSSVIPGLLQSEAYASALITVSMPGKDAQRIAMQVANRVHRQDVLSTARAPLYWAIMDESCSLCETLPPSLMSRASLLDSPWTPPRKWWS